MKIPIAIYGSRICRDCRKQIALSTFMLEFPTRRGVATHLMVGTEVWKSNSQQEANVKGESAEMGPPPIQNIQQI